MLIIEMLNVAPPNDIWTRGFFLKTQNNSWSTQGANHGIFVAKYWDLLKESKLIPGPMLDASFPVKHGEFVIW